MFSINSHNLRLNIKNELRYDKKKPKGSIEFKAINKSKKLDYVIDKNLLNFESEEETFNGKLDFKPFYLSANLKFHQLDLNKLLQSNSIFRFSKY